MTAPGLEHSSFPKISCRIAWAWEVKLPDEYGV